MRGMNEQDVFCQIVAGESKAHVVWEDEYYMAFLDKYPKEAGHTLVIPKQHVDYFWNMEDEAFGELMKVTKKVAKGLRNASGSEFIFMRLIGIDIPHVHVHLHPQSFAGVSKRDFGAIAEMISNSIND